MGVLRTSDGGGLVAGEGHDPPKADDRPVDAGAKIIIDAGPVAAVENPAPEPAKPPATPTSKPKMPTLERQGGLGLVITVYVLSAAALAYAIYERFLA